MKEKKDIKAYVIFGAVMLASMIGGFVLGRFGSELRDTIDAIDWAETARVLYVPSIVIFAAILIVFYGISFAIYARAKTRYRELTALDDEAFEEGIYGVELALNKSLVTAEVVLLLSIFCFPFVLLCRETMNRAETAFFREGIILTGVLFLLSVGLYMTIAAFIVSLEKQINPEKKGNVFDIHFAKKWLGSMDEGELMKTARASQKAYYAGIYTGLIMWVVSIVGMFTFHTGILPIFCITVIMIVMVLTEEIYTR